MDLIVDAVAAIPRDARPHLMIVADRARLADCAAIRERAERRGVELDLREGVSESEIRVLYGRAAAVVCAARREPFGLVPIEAMSCGIPVVAVREGGLRETVSEGRTGWLVARDAHCMGERIQWFLEHPGEADAMGAAGRAAVLRHWTWFRTVDRLLEIMQPLALRD